jgi:hypothetical protein
MFDKHPLVGAFQRVDRAEKHLADLQAQLDGFRQRYLDAATIYFNADSSEHARVLHPRLTPESEPILAILIGEICYNLRSALDYLVYELALLDSGNPQENTQFPIDDTPKKFNRNKEHRLVGLSLDHIAAIERYQPYSGCNWSKVLRTLSNPDKHRKLTPRGGSFAIEVVPEGFSPSFTPQISAVRRANRPDGVEVDVKLIASIDAIVPIDDSSFDIPIGDVVEETLEHLIFKIRDVLETFKPEL